MCPYAACTRRPETPSPSQNGAVPGPKGMSARGVAPDVASRSTVRIGPSDPVVAAFAGAAARSAMSTTGRDRLIGRAILRCRDVGRAKGTPSRRDRDAAQALGALASRFVHGRLGLQGLEQRV